MKIAYVTDSGSGRSIDEQAADGIYSLPLQIMEGSNSYQDLETISQSSIISLLEQKKVMTTSQPSPGLITDLFENLKAQGVEMIVAVPICNGLSGTISTMNAIAADLGLQFLSFDTYTTASVENYLIHRIKQLNEEGHSPMEVSVSAENIISSCETIVIPGDLMHLARSGRLTASAARMATLLRITPILHLNRETAGKIDSYDKVISMRRAMKRVLEHMKEANLDENWHLTITHVNAIDLAETFYHQAQEMFPKAEMEILPLCSPVAVHVGIGSLCLQYFRKQ